MLLENDICFAIERIKNYKNKKDIDFVNIQIGLYRLNAERYNGMIRRIIHSQANTIEKKLKMAIEHYNFKMSKEMDYV